MATITELINQCETPAEAISMLQTARLKKQPNLTKLFNEVNPDHHAVMDQAKRPDKKVMVNYVDPITGEPDDTKTKIDYVKVNRVTTSLQKLIVQRAVSFLFGSDVVLSADTTTEAQKEVLTAVKRVMVDCSERSHNRSLAREVFTTTESAELWYVTEGEETHMRYGKPTKYRIRVAQFKPSEGDILYPYFNAEKDLVAFSRRFTVEGDGQKNRTFFETFTADTHYMWENTAGDSWELCEGYPEAIVIGKIPVVYISQEQPEWANVQSKIERLELLLSNFADTNDYHAAPKIFVTGDIHGWGRKGESGMVIEGEDGATAQYLSWAQAPTSVQTEVDILMNLIYTETQTPDISFNTLKQIAAPSGIALKFMFMDAHLKVQDKMEIFGPALRRRVSIIKAFLVQLGIITEADAQSTIIDAEVTPFTITDEAGEIATYSAACGNKPVMSRRTAVQRLGYVDDVDTELQRIEEEEAAGASLGDIMDMAE